MAEAESSLELPPLPRIRTFPVGRRGATLWRRSTWIEIDIVRPGEFVTVVASGTQ